MKSQSGTVKNHKNQPGVAQGGYRWLQDSKEEVMIFRYRQTNRHFNKIYINLSHWVGCNQVFKRTSTSKEKKLILYPNPHHHILHCCHRFIVSAAPCHSTTALATSPAPLLVFCMEPLSLCLAQGFADFGALCDPKIIKKNLQLQWRRLCDSYRERKVHLNLWWEADQQYKSNLSQSRFHFRHTNNVCWYVGTGCKQRQNQALTKQITTNPGESTRGGYVKRQNRSHGWSTVPSGVSSLVGFPNWHASGWSKWVGEPD